MRTLVTVLLGLLATPALAQVTEYDIPAHVSAVEGDAIIERVDDGEEPLEPNITLIEGDVLQTRDGRAEVLFADGTLLHLDRDTRVHFVRADYARVMEGRVRVAIPRDARDIVRVDAPAATLELEPGGGYRISVAPNGDAELAVVAGSGAIFNERGDTRLRAGERAVAALDRAPSQAFYFNASTASLDDFDRWSDRRQRAYATSASIGYLPDELRTYGSVFDTYGRWSSHPEYGYVWYPRATASWQPYSHGRWRSYPRYGWTWVGYDPWAWPTHHFGRWGFSAGVWFWIPGRSWGPAWVSWARSPGYVGWSPLGWNNRPIYVITNARHYSSSYPWCGWSFIRERDFGGRWRSGGLIYGRGVGVIATSGVATSNVAPIAPRTHRAVPRSGTAVPRSGAGLTRGGGGVPPSGTGLAGVARPRSGNNGSGGAQEPEGRGIRDRRAPRDTPRTTAGDTPARGIGDRSPRARERDGAVSTPSTGAATGRPVRRRPDPAGSARRPDTYDRTDDRRSPVRARPSTSGDAADARAVPRTRYPYSGASSGAGSSTAPSRPVRDRRDSYARESGNSSADSSSSRAPRARSRGDAPSSAAPARAPRMRERAPDRPAPRADAPASRGSAPAAGNGGRARSRGDAPRPPAAASSGGGGSNARGGNSATPRSRKPRGG